MNIFLIFYELAGEKYHQIAESHALPKISAAKLTDFLQLSREKGQTAALKSFRAWLEELNIIHHRETENTEIL